MPVHRLQRHAARHIPRVNGALPERVAQHFRFGEQDHVILERIARRARAIRPLDRDVLFEIDAMTRDIYSELLKAKKKGGRVFYYTKEDEIVHEL